MPRPRHLLDEPLDEGPLLYYGGQVSIRRALAARGLFVLALATLVIGVFWLDREGLSDALDGHVSFTDVVYFAAVSLTTTGYGDIVPVTDRARLIDAAMLTPARLVIWLVFFGTAYQLLFRRALERLRMRRRQAAMTDHYVICGFDNGGASAAAEIVDRGVPPDRIVVIDSREAALHLAAELGHVGLRGDATREGILREARVAAARAVVVTLDGDANTVLTVLTIRALAPTVRVVARVEEPENEKLVRQSGADVTLSAARLGGILLANAVDGPAVLDYVVDLVTTAGHLNLRQRAARPEEIGKPPGRSVDGLVVRIVRDGRNLSFWEPSTLVAEGDDLVVLGPGRDTDPSTREPR